MRRRGDGRSPAGPILVRPRRQRALSWRPAGCPYHGAPFLAGRRLNARRGELLLPAGPRGGGAGTSTVREREELEPEPDGGDDGGVRPGLAGEEGGAGDEREERADGVHGRHRAGVATTQEPVGVARGARGGREAAQDGSGAENVTRGLPRGRRARPLRGRLGDRRSVRGSRDVSPVPGGRHRSVRRRRGRPVPCRS